MDQNGAGLRSFFGMRDKVSPEVEEGVGEVEQVGETEGELGGEVQQVGEEVGEKEDGVFIPDLNPTQQEKIKLDPENERLRRISSLIGDYKADDHLDIIIFLFIFLYKI